MTNRGGTNASKLVPAEKTSDDAGTPTSDTESIQSAAVVTQTCRIVDQVQLAGNSAIQEPCHAIEVVVSNGQVSLKKDANNNSILQLLEVKDPYVFALNDVVNNDSVEVKNLDVHYFSQQEIGDDNMLYLSYKVLHNFAEIEKNSLGVKVDDIELDANSFILLPLASPTAVTNQEIEISKSPDTANAPQGALVHIKILKSDNSLVITNKNYSIDVTYKLKATELQ